MPSGAKVPQARPPGGAPGAPPGAWRPPRARPPESRVPPRRHAHDHVACVGVCGPRGTTALRCEDVDDVDAIGSRYPDAGEREERVKAVSVHYDGKPGLRFQQSCIKVRDRITFQRALSSTRVS